MYTKILNKSKKVLATTMFAAIAFLVSGCGKQAGEEGTAPTGAISEVPEGDGLEGTAGPQGGDEQEAPKEGDGSGLPKEGDVSVVPQEVDTPEPSKDVPEAPKEWLVEGYDIGPATSATPLKEAFGEYFKVGVGLTGSSPRVMMLQSEAMSELVKYHFNSVTMTNLMKPSYLLDQRGSIESFKNGDGMPAVSFDSCTMALEFCKENGIGMRGHTLVWHAQVPGWFFKEGYEDDAPLVDRDTMLVRMESYIKQVITYTSENYPGVVYCWDVVNEAVETVPDHHEDETGYYIRTASGDGENLWYTVVGADYVEKAFEYARKYAPADVKLFYNDYNTFQPLKNEKICALLTDLYGKGLVDGIGMQSYYGRKDPDIKGRTGSVQRAIENFASIGLEIQITELTINIDEPDERSLLVQAMRYQELMELLMELDGSVADITSVTFFGLMDEYMFYPDNTEYSRLFDGQLQPKEAFFRILQAAGED